MKRHDNNRKLRSGPSASEDCVLTLHNCVYITQCEHVTVPQLKQPDDTLGDKGYLADNIRVAFSNKNVKINMKIATFLNL